MAENRLPARERVEPVTLIYGRDREIAHWVGRELHEFFTDCTAIGFAKDGKIIGGVVYHNYRPPSIEMSIATIDPRWCTRKVLEQCFTYPFIQLGVKRITTLVDATNQPVRAFNERIGFVHEATLRDALHDGDAALFRMLPEECKWIVARKKHGQRFIESAESA